MSKKKKMGWLGSIRAKILAGLASLLATGGGAGVVYFWKDLTGGNPRKEAAATETKRPLLATLTSMRKASPTFSCDLLGAKVGLDEERISVAEVQPGSAGALLGLKPGDIIEKVDDHEIHSPEQLEAYLARNRLVLSTVVRVRRGSESLRGEVHLNQDKTLKVRRALSPS